MTGNSKDSKQPQSEGARSSKNIGQQVGDEQGAGKADGEGGCQSGRQIAEAEGEVDEQEAADGDAGQRGEDAEEVEGEGRVNCYVEHERENTGMGKSRWSPYRCIGIIQDRRLLEDY